MKYSEQTSIPKWPSGTSILLSFSILHDKRLKETSEMFGHVVDRLQVVLGSIPKTLHLPTLASPEPAAAALSCPVSIQSVHIRIKWIEKVR